MLRDVATAARQWQVAGTAPARDAFAVACRDLADAVDAQTAEEERVLLPLLAAHLAPADWAAIARVVALPALRARAAARARPGARGLHAPTTAPGCSAGLPPAARMAWRCTAASALPGGRGPAARARRRRR